MRRGLQLALLPVAVLVAGCGLLAFTPLPRANPDDPNADISDLAPPDAPTAPADTADVADGTPLLDWPDVSGALGYHVQLSATAGFDGEILLDDAEVTESRLVVATVLSNHQSFHWRVRARDATDLWSEWSTAWTFTVEVSFAEPIGPYPENTKKIVSYKPLLNWTDVAGAAGYQVQIDTSGDMASPLEDAAHTGQSEHPVATGLPEGGTYYWRVRALDEDGLAGAWSAVWSFGVLDPGAPLVREAGPVLSASAQAWEDNGVMGPAIVVIGGTYHMWYTGVTQNPAVYRIGYATSADGLAWTRMSAGPVLALGSSGAWDDYRQEHASVLVEGSTYRMWFTGHDGSDYRTGHATSIDGLSWVKNPSDAPVLDHVAWDGVVTGQPSVLLVDGVYHLWYTSSGGIGHAVSGDGLAWTRDPAGGPVLSAGTPGSWDDAGIFGCHVAHINDRYHLWYQGYGASAYRVGHAVSTDGKTWTKNQANPVLGLGPVDAFDDSHVMAGQILVFPDAIRIYYSGADAPADGNYAIGIAVIQ